MEMDLTLFLMDHRRLNLTGIPDFYLSLFKVWGLLKKSVDGTSNFSLLVVERISLFLELGLMFWENIFLVKQIYYGIKVF